MKNTRIFNKLMLSNCPISNWDFNYIKTEKGFEGILQGSNIYMIVQRPVLYFHNILFESDGDDQTMKFEIRQKGHDEVIKATFSYLQPSLSHLREGPVKFHFMIDYEHLNLKQQEPPFNFITSILLYTDENGYGSWFTPEKMLFDFWNEKIEMVLVGDIDPFLKYKVHYIGKATEEHVLKRLTGHERLQDILSLEMPLQYGTLPTDEIAILFFEFSDNIYLAMVGDDEMTEEMFNQLMAGTLPRLPQKELYLDAEKALIHAFTPKHNRVIYKHYPNGKQNLFTNDIHNLKAFTYSFSDPISLIFHDKTIKGSQDFFDVDMLLIKKNKPLTILKSSKNKA